jgi:transposase
MVASGGDAQDFSNGRQFAAWLGLVPRQHSSGGKPRLLGISKRGDLCLRTLLKHGARSVVQATARRKKPPVYESSTHSCLQALVLRRNKNVAAVAVANTNARVIWASLAHDRHYQAGFAVAA